MMNVSLEEMNLLHHARTHGLVMPQAVGMRDMGTGVEDIDLEMGPSDDDPHFTHVSSSVVDLSQEHSGEHDEHRLARQQSRKKKRVVKKWRDEWAETYKWAYVQVHEGAHRVFCSVCKDYGRKHRRNPYGNEGSRNMQMSALEEHNNSLLHKEALRLAHASKDKSPTLLDRSLYMKALLSKNAESVVEAVMRRDPFELEYVQAVQEMVQSLEPVLLRYPQYVHVLERLLEPERVIVFRVPWVDDRGEMHVNRGFRVQFNSALGPFEGGLRFHPSVNLSIIKFLGLEQTLRNSLTADCLGGGACLGGAKGGSDFDPKGKTDNEVMRFCQSFMGELYRHIGPYQDSVDGDIGVGQRELGYLFGQYRRLRGQFEGFSLAMTSSCASSNLRTQATGYGLVYFAEQLLADVNKKLRGIRCIMSGAGKLALYTMEKLIDAGVVVYTLSDSGGYLLDNEGFDFTKIKVLKEIKCQRKNLSEYVKLYPRSKYIDERKPWSEKCEMAIPCATQNEINFSDAQQLVNGGCQFLIEGSSMPCTAEAIEVLRISKVIVGPSKAACAGGAVVAALELEHRSKRISLGAEELDLRLQEVMRDVYQKSTDAALQYGIEKNTSEWLVHGANIVSFLRVSNPMIEQGCV